MRAQDVVSKDQAKAIIEERNIEHIKIAITDLNGIHRSKYLSRKKFLSALESDFGFCDVIIGGDCDDELIDNLEVTGWHTGYPDATVRIIPESCREIPFEPDSLLFLCEFSGEAAAICPRQILKRVVKRANELGFYTYCGFEYEFTLFDETVGSAAEKNYEKMTPLTPGNFGYSMMRNTLMSDFYRDLMAMCDQMDMSIEGLHTEIGPGVLEAALTADKATVSADKANLFKTMTKVLSQRHGWMATFMAKWSAELQGQSGHFHLSILDKSGNNLFYDADAEHQMSPLMRHFVAGQQELMPEWLVLAAPNINSFARLVPGFWAPTQALWGVDNRTVALRVINGSAKSQRVEYRIGGADANPYLVAALAIASGIYGVEQKLKLGDPSQGNAYDAKASKKQKLPVSLEEASHRFSQSKIAKDYFGEAFVKDFAASRDWEVREYRKAITDWQVRRYFEII